MEQMTETAVRPEALPPRHPTDGTFELTVRCNLHCKMCLFRHDDSENPALMAKELTATQWIELARQAAEAGTLNLLITGGEPMLRPDFCEIWEGVYQQGFLITLYTNATLVTPRIMETLRKYPPHRIGVTIYGASPETYEKVCGSASAHERMIDGIRQLKTLPSVMEYGGGITGVHSSSTATALSAGRPTAYGRAAACPGPAPAANRSIAACPSPRWSFWNGAKRTRRTASPVRRRSTAYGPMCSVPHGTRP